tara:strand:+ start:363 stop:998 length:636 start_codon:yes stop_codon:yes gene_type:complete
MKKILFMMIALPSFIYAEVTANVSLTSNYVWRGVSQTGDELAIQGGFDYAGESGVYAGIWGSNVSFNYEFDASAGGNEFDVYGGYANDMFDVGFVSYQYPGNSSDLDFTEVYLGFTPIEGFSIYYYDLATSDFDGEFESIVSDYISLGYEVGNFSASYGMYGDAGDDILLSYGFGCGSFDCALSYFDFSADDSSFDELEDNGVYFSISASL